MAILERKMLLCMGVSMVCLSMIAELKMHLSDCSPRSWRRKISSSILKTALLSERNQRKKLGGLYVSKRLELDTHLP